MRRGKIVSRLRLQPGVLWCDASIADYNYSIIVVDSTRRGKRKYFLSRVLYR